MAKRRPVRIKNWKQLQRARRKLRKEVSKREELMLLRTESLLSNLKPQELGKSFARQFLKPGRLLGLIPGLFRKRRPHPSRSGSTSAPQDGQYPEGAPARSRSGKKTNKGTGWPVIIAGALAGVLLTNFGVSRLRDLFNGSNEQEGD